ncbi:hypothetical protein MELA_02903 [Candidatus Methylomirabilis lanthanidiphila]|uniref:HEPN AbiU2-like domain-containing protein n=1 Tax=Candidatus Methylomirabilis lanthanidiphila TaxID=2211376 RepID=A0A564ZME2_9BACT|nr:hypothetical protein [Candidatus Methylomirabilis lanthanidiphila]VUZ86500.1 hypothetical protein MELA_02903 [Candidatus Methylomirabilis lanthanidiphila]
MFRGEAESAIQFFYAWRAVNEVASNNKEVVAILNKAPLFWNTSLGALQTSAFIALGRVFDQRSNTHNINRLLHIGEQNPEIFSLEALAERKRGVSSTADEWLDEYLRDAYVPTPNDFRRLRKHVATRRKIYEASFRPIRHKVFAHKQLSTQVDTEALFANAKIRDIQQLLIFLRRLHEALWQLFFNGRKPILRPAPYSVSQMLAQPRPNGHSLQERLTRETEAFLKLIARQ